MKLLKVRFLRIKEKMQLGIELAVGTEEAETEAKMKKSLLS